MLLRPVGTPHTVTIWREPQKTGEIGRVSPIQTPFRLAIMRPESEQLLSLLVVGVGTAVIVIGALVVAGFILLFRRNRGGIDRVGHELETRAGSLLLRLDDEVRASEDEVEFAIAQFGTERTKAYADAVSAARADLAEGFRLRQQLDDAFEDSDRQRREWTLQIIANSRARAAAARRAAGGVHRPAPPGGRCCGDPEGRPGRRWRRPRRAWRPRARPSTS